MLTFAQQVILGGAIAHAWKYCTKESIFNGGMQQATLVQFPSSQENTDSKFMSLSAA
jgi:hypothetical protein